MSCYKKYTLIWISYFKSPLIKSFFDVEAFDVDLVFAQDSVALIALQHSLRSHSGGGQGKQFAVE